MEVKIKDKIMILLSSPDPDMWTLAGILFKEHKGSQEDFISCLREIGLRPMATFAGVLSKKFMNEITENYFYGKSFRRESSGNATE